MTSHELARKLLALPDLRVQLDTMDQDYNGDVFTNAKELDGVSLDGWGSKAPEEGFITICGTIDFHPTGGYFPNASLAQQELGKPANIVFSTHKDTGHSQAVTFLLPADAQAYAQSLNAEFTPKPGYTPPAAPPDTPATAHVLNQARLLAAEVEQHKDSDCEHAHITLDKLCEFALKSIADGTVAAGPADHAAVTELARIAYDATQIKFAWKAFS